MAKILIVDDSYSFRQGLKAALVRASHEVIEAADGESGIQKALANQDIKLIITDLNMPELDGISMVQEIKKHQPFATVPVIVLTTEPSKDMKEIGKKAGILWMYKPFDSRTIATIVEKCLATRDRGASK